jgi:uncharacterized pyridoxamine 5'-phosphate oxidase family protein
MPSVIAMNEVNVKLKQEIWQKFVELQHVFLATVDGNQPRLRPVTLIRLKDRLFVATGAEDAKVRQIKQNPKVEFCLLLEEGENKGTIRAECTAELVKDGKVKAEAYGRVPFMKEFWSNPEDPSYALIELRPTGYEYMRLGSMQAMKVKP